MSRATIRFLLSRAIGISPSAPARAARSRWDSAGRRTSCLRASRRASPDRPATKRARRASAASASRPSVSCRPLSSLQLPGAARARAPRARAGLPSGATSCGEARIARASPRASVPAGPMKQRQRRASLAPAKRSPCVFTSPSLAPARERDVLLERHLEAVGPDAAHRGAAHPGQRARARRAARRRRRAKKLPRTRRAQRRPRSRRARRVLRASCASVDLAHRQERRAQRASAQRRRARTRAPRCPTSEAGGGMLSRRGLSHMRAISQDAARTGPRTRCRPRFAAIGTRLWPVMPGEVLTSRS